MNMKVIAGASLVLVVLIFLWMFFQVEGLKREIDSLKAESVEEVGGLKREIDSLKAESVEEVEGLKREIDSLKAESLEEVGELKREMDSFKAESVDLAAKGILAEWSRDVPQQERVSDKYAVLRNSVLEPKAGAAAQLNHALMRIANTAALPLIGRHMIGQTERRKLEILNQCVEYLLGTSNATYACNMQAISP